MLVLWFALLALCLFLTVASFWKSRRLPYYSAHWLLNKSEIAFYHALREAIPDTFQVACKVRLADVIRCSDRMWHRGFGLKISTQHIDYVITNHAGKILVAIELDGPSHDEPRTKRRDRWKTRVLKKAGLPLMRVRVRPYGYHIETLRRYVWVTIRSRNEDYIRDRRLRLSA